MVEEKLESGQGKTAARQFFSRSCTPIFLEFDALITALPFSEGGEEAQLKKTEELQAENDLVGQELQKQL
ncbi:putative mediator complex, subunit Med7/Med21 [Helianthus anomalus]